MNSELLDERMIEILNDPEVNHISLLVMQPQCLHCCLMPRASVLGSTLQRWSLDWEPLHIYILFLVSVHSEAMKRHLPSQALTCLVHAGAPQCIADR